MTVLIYTREQKHHESRARAVLQDLYENQLFKTLRLK